MRACSQDLRDRVLRALDRGDRPAEIARRFEVSRVWVYLVRYRLHQNGGRSILPIGGHRRSCPAGVEAEVRSWIEAEVDLELSSTNRKRLVQTSRCTPKSLPNPSLSTEARPQGSPNGPPRAAQKDESRFALRHIHTEARPQDI